MNHNLAAAGYKAGRWVVDHYRRFQIGVTIDDGCGAGASIVNRDRHFDLDRNDESISLNKPRPLDSLTG